MTEISEKQVAIQKYVMDVMEKNIVKWKDVEEIKKKYDHFVRNLKKIEDDLLIISTDLSPLEQKSTASKEELIRKVSPIAGVLGVYAGDIGDMKLARIGGMSEKELRKIQPKALKKYCTKVIKISGDLLRPVDENKKPPKRVISGYGLTPLHLEKLHQALDQYISQEAKFLESRKKYKRSKAKLEKRIAFNNKLLKGQLDRMILLFRDSEKTFYNAYLRSRTSPAKKEPVN
jgi:hypothetical protein